MIDGYNLLHALHPSVKHETLEALRDDLVRRIDGSGKRATIFFDGGKQGAVFKSRSIVHSERLTVVFSPKGRTADDEMIARIESSKDRTAYTIVSADHAITDAAKRRRFKVMAPKEFAKGLPAKGPRPEGGREGISSAEAEAWMREFGIKE